MDYALPRADDLPSFDLGFNGTPCTTNPLGVKGCGEAGAIAAFPAIANAILDALAPLGVKGFDGPATPAAHLAGHAGQHDEAPRSGDGAQPPAHPRRAAAAPAGRRPGARGRQRLGRACRAFRRRLARSSSSSRAIPMPRRGPASMPGPDERACATSGRRVALDAEAPAWPIEQRGCRALLQHDPYRALDGGGRPDRRRGAHPAGPTALLYLYGPYRRDGRHTAPSNEAFDRDLRRARSRLGHARPRSGRGARRSATASRAPEIIEMPANNLSLIFRRS